jgi:hypothetical protein
LHAVQAARVQNTFVLAHTFLYGLPPPFTAFALFVIAGTFWYCGTKPGILAALISWRVRDCFFEPKPAQNLAFCMAWCSWFLHS